MNSENLENLDNSQLYENLPVPTLPQTPENPLRKENLELKRELSQLQQELIRSRSIEIMEKPGEFNYLLIANLSEIVQQLQAIQGTLANGLNSVKDKLYNNNLILAKANNIEVDNE